MQYNIIVSLLNLGLILLLLPRYGALGYIITIYCTRILNFLLSLARLMRVTSLSVSLLSLVKSVFCIFGAVTISDFVIHNIGLSIASSAAGLYVCIPVIIVLYLLLLRLFSCITHEDSVWIRSLFTTGG